MNSSQAMVVVLMGVSGSGKTRIGVMLARALGWEFHDGDELHSAANRNKMHRGIPLTDSDRLPWLRRIRRLIDKCLAREISAVIACSALKRSYRDIIIGDSNRVRSVYLKGSRKLIAGRLSRRTGHFMSPDLLASQFDTLEEPRDGITVDVSGTPAEIVRKIRKRLRV